MAVTVTKEWMPSAYWIDWGDGIERGREQLVTRRDDWRLTSLGLLNFGEVTLGPTREVTRPAHTKEV